MSDLLEGPKLVRFIPEDWTKTLKMIQREYPEAVIAGGSLRDLFLGKEIKDIDVFVIGTRPEMPKHHIISRTIETGKLHDNIFSWRHTDRTKIMKILDKHYEEPQPKQANFTKDLNRDESLDQDGEYTSELTEAERGRFFDVFDTGHKSKRGKEYQIIVHAKPFTNDSLLDGFDFGFGRIVYDGKMVYVSKYHIIDSDNKKFTIIDPINVKKSLARFDRFQEKYPDFILVNKFPVPETINEPNITFNMMGSSIPSSLTKQTFIMKPRYANPIVGIEIINN